MQITAQHRHHRQLLYTLLHPLPLPVHLLHVRVQVRSFVSPEDLVLIHGQAEALQIVFHRYLRVHILQLQQMVLDALPPIQNLLQFILQRLLQSPDLHRHAQDQRFRYVHLQDFPLTTGRMVKRITARLLHHQERIL